MIKALFFDFDGTLVDTKMSNYFAYKEASSLFGIEFPKDCFLKNFGKHFFEFSHEIMGKKDFDLQKKIHLKKKEIFKNYLNKGTLLKKTFEILKNNFQKFKTVLVTTASKEAIDDWDNIFNFKKYFDFIITGEDVENKKPNPESYLLALKKTGISPQEAIVFEDTDIGFSSAKNAGIKYLDVNSDKFMENVNNLLKSNL